MRGDWFQKSCCQGHEYFGTQASSPRSHCSREEQIPLPTFSTAFLLFLLRYTHLFFCNPCFPNTHQHNSHAIPLYSISICNSQSVLQKAINKLLPPPKVTQEGQCWAQELTPTSQDPHQGWDILYHSQPPVREHHSLRKSWALTGCLTLLLIM